LTKTGRPLLYDDPALLEAKIDQYFDNLKDGDVPTIAELCYELGFSSRTALTEYIKRPAFSDAIKKAKLRIEVDRTKRLVKSGSPTAGLIFDLVNNHGYKNPQHVKHSGDDDPDAKPIEVTRIELVAPNRPLPVDDNSTG
jgi:hypothetical protein